METPLLKVARKEEYQTSPTHYGSTGNNQGVRTAKEPDVRTANEQHVSTGNGQNAGTLVTQVNITGSKHDQSMKPNQARSPADSQDVITAEAYRRMKSRYKCSSTKSNITQGLLTFASLTANVSQMILITALDGGNLHPCFFLLVIMIIFSIILEIVAGAVMGYIATLDINNDRLHEKYDSLNNAVVILVYMVTFFNYYILVFVW